MNTAQHYKSEPGDKNIARDSNANPVDRANAISNLTVDGFFEFEPLLAEWLYDTSYILRSEAVRSLVGMWKKARYFEDAVRMLHTDSEWEVRADAAFALSMYTTYDKSQRERVMRELANRLVTDKDWAVQQRCYEELLRLHGRDEERVNLPNHFNPDRDVDWELIKPYLNSSQLLRSQSPR